MSNKLQTNFLLPLVLIIVVYFSDNRQNFYQACPKMPPKDYIFASYMMPQRIWDETMTRAKWISLKNYDIRTCTDTILDAVNDQSESKNIIILAYQKWAGALENKKLTKYMEEIVDAVKKQEKNKVIFGSAMFIPNSSVVWKKVGDLNESIRWYNEKLGMPPLNMHKMGMCWVSESDKTLRVRGTSFVEFQLGLGLGINPSYECLVKIKNHILIALDNTFYGNASKRKSSSVRVRVPPPLIETEGYRFNEYHRQELEDRNLGGRPRSTGGYRRSKLTWSQRRPEGWHSWDIYKTAPWTKEERERVLEEFLDELHQSSERPTWGEQVKEEVKEDVEEEAVADLIVFSEDEGFEQGEMEDREVEVLTKKLTLGDSEDREREDEDEKEVEEKDEEDCNESELEAIEAADIENSHERYNRINEELVLQYRKELSSKNVQLSKEKTATKQWKGMANKVEEEKHAMVKDLEYYKRRVEVLESQVERINNEYYFLKGLYEHGGRKRELKPTGRQYAKSGDFVVKKD